MEKKEEKLLSQKTEIPVRLCHRPCEPWIGLWPCGASVSLPIKKQGLDKSSVFQSVFRGTLPFKIKGSVVN